MTASNGTLRAPGSADCAVAFDGALARQPEEPMHEVPPVPDAQPQPAAAPAALPDADAPVRRPAGWRTWARLSVMLAIGIGARVWIGGDPRLGHESDIDFFVRWSRGLAEQGLTGFYAGGAFCDYPPLSVLMLYGIGKLAALVPDALINADAMRVILKIPACVADLAIALLLLFEGRRRLDAGLGLAAATLFFLNPVAIYGSAYWGQVDSIFTALALAALVAVGRGRWLLVGALTAAGLLAKFQTIALAPIILFETYRLGGWRGIGRWALGAVTAFALIAAPFAWTGTLDDVIARSYVHVVGQYNDLSRSAYNIWFLTDNPARGDTAVPSAIIAHVAGGRLDFPAGDSWLLKLTWRNLSLTLYSLVVAAVLSLYALRPGPIARYAAGGALGLAFFLFPTEMHERYAFPAIAFLALWAVTGAWRERIYVALTLLLLLNLAAVLPAAPLAPQIAVGLLLVFGVLLVGLPSRTESQVAPDSGPAPQAVVRTPEPPAGRRILIPVFQWLTVAAWLGAGIAATWVYAATRDAAPPSTSTQTVYLSDLPPRAVEQGWKTLARDRSVSGGMIEMAGRIYLRGLGTHAPARLVYAVPDDTTRFRALAGIDAAAGRQGSAVVRVELDGNTLFTSEPLVGGAPPVAIDVEVRGGRLLTIRVDAGPDGRRADHVNLALARFE
jgi:Gpi18-like mannosyltransferase